MKTQAFVVFAALLLFAILAAESDAFVANISPGRKRELGENVRGHFFFVFLIFCLASFININGL